MAYLIKIDTNGNAVLPTLAGNAKKADVSLNKIGKSSKASFNSLTQSATRSNSVLNKTKGLLMGLGLTLTTGAFAAGIVGLGANFQKSMSEVKALTNASAIEMKALEGSARQAGATTEHTALSSSKAMGYLAMAGFNTNQIISALPGTLHLASAGNLDLARSADIATNILTQYQMKASDTGIVVDQLAHLQATFNTSVDEAAEAMGYIGPKAAAMGISLAETNASIGILASGGYKGSLATRALGTSLVRLTKPTSEMQAKINELNLTLFDSQGKFVGMAGMIEQLEDSYASLTPQQQLNATATLFGSEAVDKWTVLLNAGSTSIRQYTEDLEGASGAAKRMAETKMDNLAGDWLKLQSATQEVGLKLFDHVAPALRAVTMEATLFVQNMNTDQVGLYLSKTVNLLYKSAIWLKNNRQMVIGLGKAYIAIRVGLYAFNKVVLLENALKQIGITLSWRGIVATKAATVANRALGVSMLMTPWGAIAAAIGLIAGALSLVALNARKANDGINDIDLDNSLNNMKLAEPGKLAPSTSYDFKKLAAGSLTQPQYAKIISDAKDRIQNAQNLQLDAKVSAKDSPYYRQIQAERAKLKDPSLNELQKGSITFQIKQLTDQLEKSIETKLGISYGNLNKIIKDNTALIDKVSPFVNDPTLRAGTTGGVITDGETTSDNVVSGGSKQRVINVTVGNIENKLNFSVHDRLNEISSSVEELYSMMNNQMMRVFNNANQLAD